MKVLITGANGMVARAAARHCSAISDEVIALSRQQLKISDRRSAFVVIESARPDVVINCAAYTDVDGAESSSDECYRTNADGPENLALACNAVGSAFVTISTDYVFDGLKSGFYDQRDTPNPLSVYGRSKLEGEVRARNAYARTIIVRSGWIFGRGGSNFLSVMHRFLSEGRGIKAIADSFGTPTFANDLAKSLRSLAELDMPATFHVTNSGPGTSYFGFAEKVCEILGIDTKLLLAVSKNDLSRPAPRPASSKLACLFSERFGLKPLPHWEASLKEFLLSKDD